MTSIFKQTVYEVTIGYGNFHATVHPEYILYADRLYTDVTSFRDAIHETVDFKKLNLFCNKVNVCNLAKTQSSYFAHLNNNLPHELIELAKIKYELLPFRGKDAPDAIIIEKFFELFGRLDHTDREKLIVKLTDGI